MRSPGPGNQAAFDNMNIRHNRRPSQNMGVSEDPAPPPPLSAAFPEHHHQPGSHLQDMNIRHNRRPSQNLGISDDPDAPPPLSAVFPEHRPHSGLAVHDMNVRHNKRPSQGFPDDSPAPPPPISALSPKPSPRGLRDASALNQRHVRHSPAASPRNFPQMEGEEGPALLDKIAQEAIVEEQYLAANLEKAEEHLKNTSFRNLDGTLYPLCTTHSSEFGRLGIGVKLYFAFLKQMALLFIILIILAFPSFVFNLMGGFLDDQVSTSVFEKSTAGNRDGIGYDVTNESTAKDKLDEMDPYWRSSMYLDMCACLIFMLFIQFFEKTNSQTVAKINKTMLAPNHYAVKITHIPADLKEKDLKEWLEKNHGPVVECVIAKSYKGLLKNYQDIAELDKKIGQEELRCEILKLGEENNTKLDKLRVNRNRVEEKIGKLLPDLESIEDLRSLRAFVVFNDVQTKVDIVKAYSKFNGKCGFAFCYDDSLKLFGLHKIKVDHAEMPSDIKWENLELTECNRFGRKSIVFLGAFFLLMCSFILVYLMKSNEGDLPESEECLVYKDVSRTTSEYKQLDSKGMEVYCYCSSQNKYDVLSDTDKTDICQDYINYYLEVWTVRILITLAVAFLNVVLKFTLRAFGRFERNNTLSKETKSIFLKLFIACFINMAVLYLLVNLNVRDWDIFSWTNNLYVLEYFLNGDYDDFNRVWYLKVSISIMILMSINVFYPHITNLLFWRPLRLFKRKYFYKSRALQMDLNALYEGAEFDVGYRYALLCANIYLCFFFAPGIPLLYFLMFLQIILIYWIDKYLLLRYYKKPAKIGDELSKRTMEVLPFGILLHIIMAIFMYGAGSIFAQEVVDVILTTSDGTSYTVYRGKEDTLLERFSTTASFPFMIIFAIIAGYQVLKRFGFTIFAICCKSSVKVTEQLSRDKTYLEELRVMSRYYICSYRMSANLKYQKISYALKNHKPPRRHKHASMKSLMHRLESYRDIQDIVVKSPPENNIFEPDAHTSEPHALYEEAKSEQPSADLFEEDEDEVALNSQPNIGEIEEV